MDYLTGASSLCLAKFIHTNILLFPCSLAAAFIYSVLDFVCVFLFICFWLVLGVGGVDN